MVFRNRAKGYWVPAHVLTAIAAARGWGGQEPNADRIDQILLITNQKRKMGSWIRRLLPFFN